MGEAINLVNNFKVENVIFNNDDYNELEIELIKVLENKKIKYYKRLKELSIGNDKLYFLNNKEYDNENDNSNVLYFKSNEYERLSEETKNKLMSNDKLEVKELVPNPILIKNRDNIEIVNEKILHQLVLEDITSFMKELGNRFSFIDSEYSIK